MADKVKVGIVGCGNISQAYFSAAEKFSIIDVVACADINMDAARAKGEENGVEAMAVDELMARPEVQIVLNLTTPQAHAEINLKALCSR